MQAPSFRGKVTNDDGTAHPDFQRWLTETISKIGNIDRQGVVTADGVDLSRSYVNKNLDNISDSSLRKSVSASQYNVLAVQSVTTSGATGTARPTTYLDLGTSATQNPVYAYDSILGTRSSVTGFTVVTPAGEQSGAGDITYLGLTQPVGTLASATLKILYVASISGAGSAAISYSLDGGSIFTPLVSLHGSSGQVEADIPLLVGQDFTKIQVRCTADNSNGNTSLFIYDVRVDYTLA